MADKKQIELRLNLSPEDELYHSFSEIKEKLGIRSNTEVGRFIIKQISKIPISNLLPDFVEDSKKEVDASD